MGQSRKFDSTKLVMIHKLYIGFRSAQKTENHLKKSLHVTLKIRQDASQTRFAGFFTHKNFY